MEYYGRTIVCKTEGISKITLPQTGFSSDWVEDYAIKTAPLENTNEQAGHPNLRDPMTWSNDAITVICFFPQPGHRPVIRKGGF